jgi:hypothetical protein
VPAGIVLFDGETVIDAITWLETVSVVDPVTVSFAAEMVVVPIATAVAKPALSIVATLVLEEVQVTCEEKF